MESIRSTPSYDAAYKRHILERLTAAETLEKYLHTRYVGQKRFSLEGGESLISQLDHLLQNAGKAGVQELVIGMAHRGRINVLVNIMGKLSKDLFAEFEGKHDDSLLAGDVKYHQGFSSNIMTPGGPMHLSLAFNPSHLEIVNPVVEGSVRARQHRRRDHTGDQVLPVLIHGDAAFAGQGVNMETFEMAQTRGYGTGGTVHLVVNNQIGFTCSDLRDARSTLYCTDIAKMLEVPIFHVNGDDPEAVCLVTEIALDYRMTFHKDVVVDLVCYRRLGHNEQDEPMVTQPLMYAISIPIRRARCTGSSAPKSHHASEAVDGGTFRRRWIAIITQPDHPPITVRRSEQLEALQGDQMERERHLQLPRNTQCWAGHHRSQKFQSRVEKIIRPAPDGAGRLAAGLGHGGNAGVHAQRGLFRPPFRTGFGRALSSTATPCCTTRIASAGTRAPMCRCST
jgi:hypothetical protein